MKILAILEFALVALCILGSFVSGTNFIISFFLASFIYLSVYFQTVLLPQIDQEHNKLSHLNFMWI